jgi:sugar phosphate isomerase/epimerase
MVNRREFIKSSSGLMGAVIGAESDSDWFAFDRDKWKLNYMVSSCLYGYMDIQTILPEIRKSNAVAIDIWPKIHGNQREQLDEIGEDNFRKLLRKNKVSLGGITQFKLGPFALDEEIVLASRFKTKLIVTGAKGPKGLAGDDLKNEVKKFVQDLQPTIKQAEKYNVTIAIENHSSSLIHSPDSIKWLLELAPSPNIAIAFAPYHLELLPIKEKEMADLIRYIDNRLALFYAWQHGEGSLGNITAESRRKQLPGIGPLDFIPLLEALKSINYAGWTEIFMHAFPRGEAIDKTAADVTAHINTSRAYLETCINKL